MLCDISQKDCTFFFHAAAAATQGRAGKKSAENPRMEGFSIKNMSDAELTKLEVNIKAERARRAQRTNLPEDHKLTIIRVDDLAPGIAWQVVINCVDRALNAVNIEYESIFVDMKKTRRATVRFLFEKEAHSALDSLKQEFSECKVYIVAPTAAPKKVKS